MFEETSLDVTVCLRIQTALRGLRIKSRASVNCPLPDFFSHSSAMLAVSSSNTLTSCGPRAFAFTVLPFFSFSYVCNSVVFSIFIEVYKHHYSQP